VALRIEFGIVLNQLRMFGREVLRVKREERERGRGVQKK
jgi:hypothetical protein